MDAHDITVILAARGLLRLTPAMIESFRYSAERWQQMTDPDVIEARPYLRYVCSNLPDSRLSHREKHGLIFSASHHFWDIWYPLNGPGCLCSVTSVSEDLLRRRGWKVSDNRNFEFPTPDRRFDFNIGKLAIEK